MHKLTRDKFSIPLFTRSEKFRIMRAILHEMYGEPNKVNLKSRLDEDDVMMFFTMSLGGTDYIDFKITAIHSSPTGEYEQFEFYSDNYHVFTLPIPDPDDAIAFARMQAILKFVYDVQVSLNV